MFLYCSDERGWIVFLLVNCVYDVCAVVVVAVVLVVVRSLFVLPLAAGTNVPSQLSRQGDRRETSRCLI